MKRTKTLHTLHLNDANNTIITTRKPKRFHEGLISKFKKHLENPLNYIGSHHEFRIIDQFDNLVNGVIVS